jgi:hypothetical protein
MKRYKPSVINGLGPYPEMAYWGGLMAQGQKFTPPQSGGEGKDDAEIE